ncbi:MAG: hypothetical protein HOM69_16445 [Gammaproteobacteria bacterium]|jgi:hypothetical protein|nr:hypothetical protein [Gammaproteobacteria bacterium]
MPRILLTLLVLSASCASAAPASILTLLYNTDDLTFLQNESSEAASSTTSRLSQDQAQTIAADLKASLASDNPRDPIYLAKQLANVGMLQTYAGDLTAGDQSLRAALSHFNQNQSLFDPRLPRLLSAIGINGFLREDYDTAEDHFRWSQNIQHRSHGLFAAEQTPNLNWLTRVYLSTDQTDAADIAQRYVLSIAEQVLPAGSPALSEIKIGIAAYLGQRANTISLFAEDLDRLLRQTLFTDSVDLLDQAILEITAAEGPYSVKLIDALETKARVYSWRGRSNRLKEQALTQILTVIQNQPVVKAESLRDAWLALADGYILTGNEKAVAAYRSAWLAINPAPASDEVASVMAKGTPSIESTTQSLPAQATILTDPVLLWPDAYEPIYFGSDIDPDPETPTIAYAVELGFTISTKGRVKRIKVLRENVPNREVRWTRTNALNSRYRPALRNGVPEEADFALRQEFLPRPAKTLTQPAPADADPVDPSPADRSADG